MEPVRHYRATQSTRRQDLVFNSELGEIRHEFGVLVRRPRKGVAEETVPSTAHDNSRGRRGHGKKRYRPGRNHMKGEW